MTDILDSPLVAGSEAWSKVITASKVAAIMGLSPYDSPLSCWHKMRGNIPLEQETEDHRRGHYAEPSILAWFRDQHDVPTAASVLIGNEWAEAWEDQPQYRRDDLPWAAATPDARAWVDNEPVLVEAKSARDMDEWGEPGTDEIPAYYLVQILFQQHLSGIRRTYVPVWGPWFEMAEYVVDYDETLAVGIVGRCREFWESLTADHAPPLDDTLATFQTLKALHPLIDKGDVANLDRDTAIEFVQASIDFKAAEARKRAAQSAVLDAMGNAQYADHDGVRVARRQPAKGDSIALYVVPKTADALTSQETPA
jgi:putative phage-type endonuclease